MNLRASAATVVAYVDLLGAFVDIDANAIRPEEPDVRT